MREGLSEPTCRSRLQTTLSCAGLRIRVVSVKEKVGHRIPSSEYRGDERKQTIDDVSKALSDDVETRYLCVLGRRSRKKKVQEEPVYCLNGVRHEDGVTLVQAFMRNVRTCILMRRLKLQVENPQGR
jgi:hypothetical protein